MKGCGQSYKIFDGSGEVAVHLVGSMLWHCAPLLPELVWTLILYSWEPVPTTPKPMSTCANSYCILIAQLVENSIKVVALYLQVTG